MMGRAMKLRRLRVGARVLVGLGLSFSAAHRARGGQEADGRADAFVGAEMREQRIPGLELAVLRDGIVVKEQGYGLADVELYVAVEPANGVRRGAGGGKVKGTAECG